MDSVPSSWWWWFNGAVLVLLAFDLGVFNRKNHVFTVKESLLWTLFWVVLALGFNGWLVTALGQEAGLQFFTGYLIEKSLSVDNLFVFLLLFRYFSVPQEYQHRVLFWGIIGALVMRAMMIFAGVALLNSFDWVIYVFGFVLLWTAWRMLGDQSEFDPTKNKVFLWISRHLPVSDRLADGKFWFRENGRLYASRLVLVLILVELSDVVFAVDSIPAILAVTRDTFLVYTSNVMALLGLRSLYFALASGLARFRYLHTGLAAVLAFVGLKMLLSPWLHVPTLASLGVVVTLLGITVAASVYYPEEPASPTQ